MRSWRKGLKNPTPPDSSLVDVWLRTVGVCPVLEHSWFLWVGFPSGVCLWTMLCISSVWKRAVDLLQRHWQESLGNCLLLFLRIRPWRRQNAVSAVNSRATHQGLEFWVLKSSGSERVVKTTGKCTLYKNTRFFNHVRWLWNFLSQK